VRGADGHSRLGAGGGIVKQTLDATGDRDMLSLAGGAVLLAAVIAGGCGSPCTTAAMTSQPAPATASSWVCCW